MHTHTPDQKDQKFRHQIQEARADATIRQLTADSLSCRAAFAFFDALEKVGRRKNCTFKAKRQAIHSLAEGRLPERDFKQVQHGIELAIQALAVQRTRQLVSV